ncbi:MAG: prepilin peptidase [Acidobacteriota bacterium]|jgi:leader peptidase (prepilin peptidase)/N-methyltransferase|nr:prepilin peptidase [Acidobacteriota bacterium]
MSLDALRLTILSLLGLAVGSFLNVCVHRLPRGQSLVRPGSRCPQCGYELRWYDNIPVVSYLVLGGRCRACRKHIAVRYPALELATLALFLLHGAVFGWTGLLAVRLLFACAMVVLFAIDLEHHLLPDAITLPGIAAGLLFSLLLPPGLVDALLGVLVGGGVLWLIGEAYFRYSGQEGMGGGDVKMLAMIGAFLGWKLVLVTLVLSSVAGSLIGVLVIAVKRGGMKYALPYGTFLALGALAASLAGDQLINWYVSFY